MSKSKSSQSTTSLVVKRNTIKKKEEEKTSKRKQTFNLRRDTVKRLWIERIRSEKTLSEIIDELVLTYLPEVNLDKKENRKTQL
ncbi:MAG TPA: hypothetical protein P5150_04995 [Candidatus Ratteibacteria bacterium]|nr:hypothetical protein [Candidatus Ratteibacteria bacterium]